MVSRWLIESVLNDREKYTRGGANSLYKDPGVQITRSIDTLYECSILREKLQLISMMKPLFPVC